MRIAAGLALIGAFIVLRLVAVHRIFAAWRTADRRAWSEAVRPIARRQGPFRMFAWSRVAGWYEYQWTWRTPEWVSASPRARRWLRVYRWSAVLFVGGGATILSSVM